MRTMLRVSPGSKVGRWTKLTLGCHIAQYNPRNFRRFLGEKNFRHGCASAGDHSNVTALLRVLTLTTTLIRRRMSCVFKERGSFNQLSGRPPAVLGALI